MVEQIDFLLSELLGCEPLYLDKGTEHQFYFTLIRNIVIWRLLAGWFRL